MEIEVKTFIGCETEFAKALSIRQRVFVIEQKVPAELERDEFDTQAMHVLLLADAVPVGTGRWFADPEKPHVARLGRVAVLKEYRGLRFGQVIIARLLEEIKKRQQFSQVLIHAQSAVVDLYARFGFKRVGEQFFEAGIAHYEMVYQLQPNAA
ncbi:MAG: GNAT family N-acetyltransferase [Candidatus Riflebacteria bacterium HGW-Riflebacteria-1]|jgi:predicted GNAT family N-acyltransferase|nr:MAG: GNAT family N-acetyltransferase [Candidatus Riflebacteria bacterium HGW-Riflebacteria-1]